ncbi:MAG: glycosyltransferase family 2 protein, partial [bacterium]
PTTLSPDGRTRAPHLRSWRDGWRHLRFLLLYSPRWLFLYPGGLLMLAGLMVLLWLVPGPQLIAEVRFDVHTLLYGAAAIIIGFQSLLFAVFTKKFAISEGLLPEDPRLNRAFRYVTLEVGLVVGLLLIIAGLAGSAYAYWYWDRHSFGNLDPAQTMRIVIPAVTCLTVGCQTLFSSFFLSILGLKRR